MSNIFTESVRFCLLAGASMSRDEAEALARRAEGDRGSYWVPVWYSLATPGFFDLQTGSGKGAGLFNLDPEDFARFARVWVRFADEGASHDVISSWSPSLGEDDNLRFERRRPCRYGFDAVHVVARDRRAATAVLPSELPWRLVAEAWHLDCAGSYLALNTRHDMAVGPGVRLGDGHTTTPEGLATPTTPSHGESYLDSLEPASLDSLIHKGSAAIAHVDLLYAGRVVHRAGWAPCESSEEDQWLVRGADDWDNCRDDEYLREMRPRA